MSDGKRRQLLWSAIGYLVALSLIMMLVNTSPVQSYIEKITISSVATHGPFSISEKHYISGQEAEWLRQIEDMSQSINEPPVNARIDRVWQAIPGYNGLEVDVWKSYAIAKKLGQVQLEQLVINEVEPKINLEDLPPAAIYRGNPKKSMVAFMVNVAWGTEYINQMLDIFDKYQVKATFFLDGMWLSKNKEMAQEILKRGHEVGNHAYSHPDMRSLSIPEIHKEISQTEALIKELGTKSQYFAPPAGAYDERVVKVARELGMFTVLWTLDTVDWKKPSPQEIISRIVPRLENGALILMHPTKSTVAALPRLLEGAMQMELQAGTVAEVLSPSRTLSVVRIE